MTTKHKRIIAGLDESATIILQWSRYVDAAVDKYGLYSVRAVVIYNAKTIAADVCKIINNT